MSCPKNCIEERTTLCLVYDGPDISEYGISKGDPINDVIIKLISGSTPSTPEVVEPTVITNTYNRSNTSTCARQITNSQFTYEVTSSNSGGIVSWVIPNNLPSGFNLYTTKVTASGNGLIGSSNSASGSVTVLSERFPVTLDIEQRVGSPCGDIKLTKTINIASASSLGIFKNNLDITDLNNTPTEQTLDESIQDIYDSLSKQQQSIDDFKVTDCESKINILSKQLESLSSVNPLSSVNYTNNGVVNTGDLSSILSDLFSTIKTLEAELFTLRNHQESLQIQVNNVQVQ